MLIQNMDFTPAHLNCSRVDVFMQSNRRVNLPAFRSKLSRIDFSTVIDGLFTTISWYLHCGRHPGLGKEDNPITPG
jgi:hypothetical protein